MASRDAKSIACGDKRNLADSIEDLVFLQSKTSPLGMQKPGRTGRIGFGNQKDCRECRNQKALLPDFPDGCRDHPDRRELIGQEAGISGSSRGTVGPQMGGDRQEPVGSAMQGRFPSGKTESGSGRNETFSDFGCKQYASRLLQQH